MAGAGETLVDADYSQIELRILAHITGDEHMQQAFLNGADIHRSTAAKIYHIPESEVTPQLRSASKAINFGIMYGKGAYSLSKDLGIPVKEADTFLKTYLDTFPKVDGYMKDCIAHAKDKGYVETLFGRRRALPELASSNFRCAPAASGWPATRRSRAPRRTSLNWPWSTSGSACGTKNCRRVCFCRYTMS